MESVPILYDPHASPHRGQSELDGDHALAPGLRLPALLALLLAVTAITGAAAQQACPAIHVLGHVRAGLRSVIIRLRIVNDKKNPTTMTARNVAVRVTLPAGFSVHKSRVLDGGASKYVGRAVQPVVSGGSEAYFLNINLEPGKAAKIAIKAKATHCALAGKATLSFNTVAYQTLPWNVTVVCPIAGVARVRREKFISGDRPARRAERLIPSSFYQGKNHKKAAKLPPCPAPTPPPIPPDMPFVPYGAGQRCAQAGCLAPFDSRRRGRALSSVITSPEECW